MADYTYIRSKLAAEQDEEARLMREKYKIAMEKFEKEYDSLISHLVFYCKRTVESYVEQFYSTGKMYGIEKHGWFSKYYTLECRLNQFNSGAGTAWISFDTWVKGALQTPEDAYAYWAFPNEEVLHTFIQNANRILQQDEIEISLEKEKNRPCYHLFIRANLGVL